MERTCDRRRLTAQNRKPKNGSGNTSRKLAKKKGIDSIPEGREN
jgi:hypothetical protein